ncbi:MAG: SDR family oxidoreductase [Maribacter sp.]|nr:SDR family oxidoreductase [Maribacter sp.]
MIRAIGIMGCGWLGLPLAKTLIKDGYQVHGTTTSKNKLQELHNAGIAPYLISISENSIDGTFEELLRRVDLLIINIPPKLRGSSQESYIRKMQLVLGALAHSKVRKLLFVSSTSVYGDIKGIVTEETVPHPNTLSGTQLLASEKLFSDLSFIETTIIRFGGLIGKDRHPITHLSGKKGLKNGNHPINLIHLKDCVSIIREVINNNWWGELFNAVYPLHPSKKDYYEQESRKRGMALPCYTMDSPYLGKKIDPSKLIHVKKYVFKTSILG